MLPVRRVADYATKPLCMGRNQTLEEAQRTLRAHDAECVVVVHRGHPIGVVSRRDLSIVDALSDMPVEGMTVQDVMIPSLLRIDVDTPVADVLRLMATEQQPVAVLTRNGVVSGVFTSMEALRVIAATMAERSGSRAAVVERSRPSLTRAVD
jgi:acetoin utilization protein AcuB